MMEELLEILKYIVSDYNAPISRAIVDMNDGELVRLHKKLWNELRVTRKKYLDYERKSRSFAGTLAKAKRDRQIYLDCEEITEGTYWDSYITVGRKYGLSPGTIQLIYSEQRMRTDEIEKCGVEEHVKRRLKKRKEWRQRSGYAS